MRDLLVLFLLSKRHHCLEWHPGAGFKRSGAHRAVSLREKPEVDRGASRIDGTIKSAAPGVFLQVVQLRDPAKDDLGEFVNFLWRIARGAKCVANLVRRELTKQLP